MNYASLDESPKPRGSPLKRKVHSEAEEEEEDDDDAFVVKERSEMSERQRNAQRLGMRTQDPYVP